MNEVLIKRIRGEGDFAPGAYLKRNIHMKAHFVTFLSPGTMVSEEDYHSIDSWDVDYAVTISRNITQRYGATPYGFYFTTRERKDNELDSKIIKKSNMYYLGGDIFTLEDIKARNNPKDRILISNMECNGYDRIIENNNSYKSTFPLNDGDVVLDYSANKGQTT